MCIGYETSCSIALLSNEKNYSMNSFREYLENRRHTEVEQEKKPGQDGQTILLAHFKLVFRGMKRQKN